MVIVIDYYLPGYLAGGPVKTISNLVERLGDRVNFLVLTLDRDISGENYDNIITQKVYRVGKSDVIYFRDKDFNHRNIVNILKISGADILYLNSFFSLSTVKLLLCRRLFREKMQIILAVRGEFSESALAIKGLKKRAYLNFFRALNLGNGITYQASSNFEFRDIIKNIGPEKVIIAADLPEVADFPPIQRLDSTLKVVFLSRIVPMKNLDYAIEILKQVDFPLKFDIYGPLEDENYWIKCQQLIADLPPQIEVNYLGAVAPHEVENVFSTHDVFLFPSRGENYGHVVFEALASGCTTILSDRTPWRNLEEHNAGWVLSLDNKGSFREILAKLYKMTPDDRFRQRRDAQKYAQKIMNDSESLQDNLRLFGFSDL
ncbi:glycosyltransferase family 4 protein [Deinococcus sp. VB343]|uniref:glycosyltransferase family 4 protein n=1 Tax=Deinococcus sp. VB343 TaxID=3385567 RepID=UPI0039C9CC08